MNKGLLVYMLVLTLCISVIPQWGSAAVQDTSSQIVATLLNQDPDPVQPGMYVDVRFKIENIGLYQASDLVFQLQPNYPFSLDPGDTPIRQLGTFYGKAVGDNSATLYYRLRVDPKAGEGDNKILLKYSTDNGKNWATFPDFSIRIKTLNPQVDVTDITTTPSILDPGKNAKVIVKITNFADSFVQDAVVSLDLSSMPFAPINSTAQKRIKIINAGESFMVPFDIVTLGNADSNIYKVPIRVSYKDQSGTDHNTSSFISMVVGTPPDILVLLDKQNVYRSAGTGTVSIKFVNKGVTNAKFMNVQILPNDQVDVISSSSNYIGKLDSDDYSTIDFQIYIKPTSASSVKIPLRVDYSDPNNQAYHQNIDLEMKLYSDEELKKFGMVQGNNLVGIVIVIVIVVAGFFLYRRFRKSKQKE
jgi:hypothetical protein